MISSKYSLQSHKKTGTHKYFDCSLTAHFSLVCPNPNCASNSEHRGWCVALFGASSLDFACSLVALTVAALLFFPALSPLCSSGGLVAFRHSLVNFPTRVLSNGPFSHGAGGRRRGERAGGGGESDGAERHRGEGGRILPSYPSFSLRTFSHILFAASLPKPHFDLLDCSLQFDL